MMQLPQCWQTALSGYISKGCLPEIEALIHAEKSIVYPPRHQRFAAFALCPWSKVKVILIGQDPYHGAGQAMGLSFSVPEGVTVPPSLRNIHKELCTDLGVPLPTTGNLTPWAQSGVLLLNTCLTVSAGKANSHRSLGWEEYTDGVVSALSEQKTNLVFLLWGAHSRSKKPLIDTNKHYILEAPHPSPLSAYRGFFGSKPFSQANAYLEIHEQSPIDWALYSYPGAV